MEISVLNKKRDLLFACFSIGTAAIFLRAFKAWVGLSLSSDLYSHIVVIPIVSGYFIYKERRRIFSDVRFELALGITLIAMGGILCLIGRLRAIETADHLSVMIVAALTVWVGGFALFYGSEALKAASFPLLFLLFMIPVPVELMNPVIHFLRAGSTDSANGIFSMSGVPFAHAGFKFYLPNLTIEVAKACSGIRSGIALFIVAVLTARTFLRTTSRRLLLVLASIPISMVKNGVRIVTLGLLGAYVDPGIFASPLHRDGGILFFIGGLLLLWIVLVVLRKWERKRSCIAATGNTPE